MHGISQTVEKPGFGLVAKGIINFVHKPKE
jgi:hypothetical protein